VERIAGWSAGHRKTAVFGWLIMVAVVFMVGHALGGKTVPAYDAGQSGAAEQTLQKLGVTTPAVEDVLITTRHGGATFAHDPLMRHAATQVVTALARLPHAAADVRSPLTSHRLGSAAGPGLVSANGHSALVTFQVPGPAADQATAVAPAQRAVAAVAAKDPGLSITEGGDASSAAAINTVLDQGFRRAEATSIPVTLVLLLLVFGALVAAGIPLLLAITSVMTALSVLTVISHWLPVGQSSAEVVVLVGMAVGIDYSLFYLRREREERSRGATPAAALRTAAATSGRAILVSGVTVMMALAGLFLTGYDVFTGIALGTITVVGVAVLGSLTVLPALLSWLGPKAERGRIPFLGRRRTAARPSRVWAVAVRRVVRHPVIWGGAAAIVLLALAAPALGMRLGEPAVDLPSSSPVLRTLDQVQRAFPQSPSPAQVVVTGHDLNGPAMTGALAGLRARATATGRIHPPITVTPVGGGRALLVGVPLAVAVGHLSGQESSAVGHLSGQESSAVGHLSGQESSAVGHLSGQESDSDATSNAALLDLRGHILPATLGRVPGVSYAVAGDTASSYDDTAALHSSTPIVIGFVIGLAFLLLVLAFRSIAIPLVSIVLNLLSVGAGYGLITLIFQDGRLQGTLGYTSFGAIISWVPLFMFELLFGLSMDYHVFILSRIKELRSGGASTSDAVVGGISTSAGVVTSAAVIMVAVFSILATLPIVDSKTLGVGLAAAILIDATVVRGILLPAALTLLGDRCWRLPRWLSWLPGRNPRWAVTPDVPDHREFR
jgi:RND superfamily putative drug exporter